VLGQTDEGFLHDVFGEVRIPRKSGDVAMQRGLVGRE
jgi:hypothetical protein